jgi:hypothetical protein
MLRRKLLFIEETFFDMAEKNGVMDGKTAGLGYIVGDLADQVRAIYDKLYGRDDNTLASDDPGFPGDGRRH